MPANRFLMFMGLLGAALGVAIWLATGGLGSPVRHRGKSSAEASPAADDRGADRGHLVLAICAESDIAADVTAAARSGIEHTFGPFGVKVVDGPAMALPQWTYNQSRNQYLGDDALLRVPLPENADYSLGIVGQDLYTQGLSFVFGLAKGQRAVISTFRLARHLPFLIGYRTMDRRVEIEAVHEVGHLLGLGHCSNPHCVMYFSRSLADTDRKGFDLCDSCKRKLAKLLKR